MYVELNVASAFSFLRASSLPEELVAQAASLGYPALALVDRDGLSGAPRFFKAARKAGVRPIVGGELTLEGGGDLPLLVESREGYRNLCRLITRMKAGAEKGCGALRLSALEAGDVAGLVALPGVSTLGRVPDAERLALLLRLFGRRSLAIDVQRHRRRAQEASNQALLGLADGLRLTAVATNGVRHATPQGRPLLDVLTCIRERRTLSGAGRLLAGNAERHLKPPGRMEALFRDRPDLVRNAAALAERLRFTLDDLGYRFPDYPVPAGESQISFLRAVTQQGARERYRPYHERARRQVERELQLIGKLELAGYFLIVWDIVNFCRRERILCQGRGSAANSAVCYSLGITAVDPVGMELLFERFLSEERGEWPDIDLDLPSGERRERVIQYVYARYGERGAAMTANVITYRERSASREIGKVLGIPEGDVDRLARQMRRFEWRDPGDTLERRLRRAGLDGGDRRVALFARLFEEIQDLPRHLGQHSGGMVIAQGRLDAVVPLEPATMPGRVVIQWDKEDCADLGIVKVDLLGLGMLAAIEDTLSLLREHAGVVVDLAHLPQDDPKVYAMLRQADTVGVFQVESRAQMATLPRMRPERFYDLVVEVAIIRPGPIVGKMVHPYLDRRNGREPVTYPHPSLEPILKRTLGVPLFQEQLLRMAMTVAGFTGGEAEELRRAMGFKRSEKRMREIEVKLREGMRRNGIAGDAADAIVRSITSFALYGFPESHAASFALIAYASAYLRAYHTAAFTCALLNNQPMGFYRPLTLVKDAQRHGVRVLPIDATRSAWDCTLEGGAVRLGLRYAAGLRQEAGERLAAERDRAPFRSLQDLVDRCALRRDERRRLAEIGALNGFGLTRRSALWQVEKAGRPVGPLLRDLDEATEETEATEADDRYSGLRGEESQRPEDLPASGLHRESGGIRGIAPTALRAFPPSDSGFARERGGSGDLPRRRYAPCPPPTVSSLVASFAETEAGGGLAKQSGGATGFAERGVSAMRARPRSRGDGENEAAETGLRPTGARRPGPPREDATKGHAGSLHTSGVERPQRGVDRRAPAETSPLPEMDLGERLRADLVGTGVTVGPHPVALFRDRLRARGVRSAADLAGLPDGVRVRVAGAVICRQRPGTAKGFLFLTLEDETGLVNVTVRPDLFERRHAVLLGHDLLEIEGALQNRAGTSVRALEVEGVDFAR